MTIACVSDKSQIAPISAAASADQEPGGEAEVANPLRSGEDPTRCPRLDFDDFVFPAARSSRRRTIRGAPDAASGRSEATTAPSGSPTSATRPSSSSLAGPGCSLIPCCAGRSGRCVATARLRPPAGARPRRRADLHLHHDHADLPSLRRIGRDVRLLTSPGGGVPRASRLRHGHGAGARGIGPGRRDHGHCHRGRHPSGGRFERDSAAVGFLLAGAGSGSTSPATPISTTGWRDLPATWTSRCCRYGAGGRASAPGTSTQSAPRARQPCSRRGSRFRSIGERSTPSAWRDCAPAPLRAPPRDFVARARDLAPQVEVRVLAPGESTSLA